MTIQWYPGHMAKAIRQIKENLKLVDVVLELADARMPYSSRNPELAKIHQKPSILGVTKGDLADPKVTEDWLRFWRNKGERVVLLALLTGQGMELLVKEIAKEGNQRRPPRVLVMGIPNVGKSSLINRLSGKKGTKVGARPGVTKGPQWISAHSFQLLDTPGILWPKLTCQEGARRLAVAYSIRDEILDCEGLALWFLEYLMEFYPERLFDRYGVSSFSPDILSLIGKKRGCLRAKGMVDIEASAHVVLDDFRKGKLGAISLERPSSLLEPSP